MRVSEELITPVVAREMLQMVDGDLQRRVRPGVVALYAKQMIDGDWVVGGDAICFDSLGRLVNGQHRLRAVVLSGTDQRFLVRRNLDRREVRSLDMGVKRTLEDVFRFEGKNEYDKTSVAVARFLVGDAKGRPVVGRSMSARDVEALITRHREALMFGLDAVGPASRGLRSACVIAAFVAAWYYVNHDDLREAGEALRSGYTKRSSIMGQLTRFRDWLLANGGGGGSSARHCLYLKTQRYIKAFVENENIQKLYVPSSPIYHVPGVTDDGDEVQS